MKINNRSPIILDPNIPNSCVIVKIAQDFSEIQRLSLSVLFAEKEHNKVGFQLRFFNSQHCAVQRIRKFLTFSRFVFIFVGNNNS